MRDLLATAGSFVLLEALLLGLTRLVLDPKPPRHLVLAIGPARSDVAEFGAHTSFAVSSGPCGLDSARPKASMSAQVGRSAQALAMWT